MTAECVRRGWKASKEVKDEGYSAGTLKRPGLAELRWLIQSGEYDGVMCTWYDRLTRSREFYVLDGEFKAHGIEFITLHDAADTRTAAGRFMESMIVAAKTYDREQTAEKVRTKMRMRQEKGLHQGGLVPFGFLCDKETKLLSPDPDKLNLLEQIFRTYTETSSDFAVRDWLKAHNIPAPHGKGIWQVSSIRDLLCNRRYIGEIEINRKNKDVEGVPESEAYRIVKADYAPMVPVELFELAQAIRKEKSGASPGRAGRPRSYSQNQCQRVFTLQGRLLCGVCGHAMTPYYIVHKAGKDRKRGGYVYYYICARQQMDGRVACGHSNRVLARVSEGWVLDRVNSLVQNPGVLDDAFEAARRQYQSDSAPQQNNLELTNRALRDNQTQIDKMVEAITSDGLNPDLLLILNNKASQLRVERQQLMQEKKRLTEALMPLGHYFDALPLRERLRDFDRLAQDAEPQELQRLMRLMVKRVEWMPDGNHAVEFHRPRMSARKGAAFGSDSVTNEKTANRGLENQWLDGDLRLESNVRLDGPDRIHVEPLVVKLIYAIYNVLAIPDVGLSRFEPQIMEHATLSISGSLKID